MPETTTHQLSAVVTALSSAAYEFVCTKSQTQKGVHVETAFSTLGALAGFGCQIGVRDGLVKPGLVPLKDAFVVIGTNDGGTYYFGDLQNKPLIQDPFSVYSIITGAIISAGCNERLDIETIMKNVAASVGSANFGKLTVPQNNWPLRTPQDTLKQFWHEIYSDISCKHYDKFNPMELGLIFAVAANKLIIDAKNVISPYIAGQIIMETAMAMSKIDPAIIGHKIN